MKQRKEQSDFGGIKLRLHEVVVQEVAYRVLTPAISSGARYSAKFYHRGWHLKFHQFGTWLLSGLFWGLSHETPLNTVVFLGPEFVDEASDPILITTPELSTLDVERFAELRERMVDWNYVSHRPKTVYWETRDLEEEILELSRHKRPWLESVQRENTQLRVPDKMVQCGGMVCYFVQAPLLRDIARLLLSGWGTKYLGVQTEFKISRQLRSLQLCDSRQIAFEQEKWQRVVAHLKGEAWRIDEENSNISSGEIHQASSRRTKVDRRRQNGKCTFPSLSH